MTRPTGKGRGGLRAPAGGRPTSPTERVRIPLSDIDAIRREGETAAEAVRRAVRETAEREDPDPPDPYRPVTDDEIAAAERETERDIYKGRRR